ncbi:MAG: hypothetical protein ACK40O_00465 [Allosphingosinicella sp.]
MRIKVGIRPFQPYESVNGLSSPIDLTYHEFTALVDTGALRTCVTERVVQALALKRRGRIEIWNIKRPEQHWTYLFHVGIWPEPLEPNEPASIFGIGSEVEGIDVGDNRFFDVLLGMDIISQGSLHLKLDGTFEIAFPG